ncbi:MAG: DNA-binding protein [Nitrosopumilaceae archaeon]
MSEEDKELEKLKEKRLAEMQKNISFKQKQEELVASHKEELKNAPSTREILVRRLGYRGLEVLENAEAQFPNETKIVVEKLAELISSGELNEDIDGGKLLVLFRAVGLNVRVKTKINIEQEGKFVSLSEKLSSKYSKPESKNEEDSE